VSSGSALGLIMTKTLREGPGYVYYIAVARASRRKGVARLLLDDALRRFKQANIVEVFAGVVEDNEPSELLFTSAGFSRTSFGEVSRGYGLLHTLNMYNAMRVVPGEILLSKRIV